MMEPTLTETELQIENQEMQMSPIETAMMDYEACDVPDRLRIVQEMIKRKKWAGKLNKTLDQFSPNELKNFYLMLLKLANPVQDNGTTQGKLPWEDYVS